MFCMYLLVALVLKFRVIAFAILLFIYGHANKAFVVVRPGKPTLVVVIVPVAGTFDNPAMSFKISLTIH